MCRGIRQKRRQRSRASESFAAQGTCQFRQQVQPTGKKSGGFSLAEALFTVAIISIALLGIGGVFPVGYQNTHYGGTTTAAADLGQQKIEWLRNLPFDLGATCTSPPSDLVCLDTAGVPPSGTPSEIETVTGPDVSTEYSFTRRSWVRIQGTPPYRFADITITLEWDEGTLGTKNVRLDARVAE